MQYSLAPAGLIITEGSTVVSTSRCRSTGPPSGFRTRALPHRAEAHPSGTCTGPETSQTTAQSITVGIERRHNMQPSAALAQEVVATRTTGLDRAIYARVGVRNRRDAQRNPET